MRILISILTSSKPDLAKLCYDSIVSQQQNPLNTDIVVIVNSTNPDHLEDIRQLMPPNTNIQETESNGRPGKGHNSVLRHFQQHPEYDYCILVDGDDFLYPRALSRLEHYLQYEPDVLFVAFHDILQSELPDSDANIPYITFRNKCCLSYNVDDTTISDWHRIKGAINPFKCNINQMNTYARPFVFSRKSVNHDIFYDENMRLYDDFIVFLKCFELHMIGKLKTYAAVDSNLYLYNSTSLDAASKQYFSPTQNQSEERIKENEYYQTSIKNRFLTLKRWDLKQFPLLELGQTSESDNFLVKCKFVDFIATKIRLQCMIPRQDNMDIILKYCKETGNTVFYDDLIQTLEWMLYHPQSM
jgi:hypothetical protein